MLHQPRFGVVVGVELGLHEADGFDTARYDHGHLVDDDPLSGEGDRLQARRAEPVHGHTAGGDGQAGADGGGARDVVAGGSLGKSAPQDDVLDFGGVNPCSLHRFGDHVTRHRGSVGLVEPPAGRLADAGPRSRNDDGFLHEATI